MKRAVSYLLTFAIFVSLLLICLPVEVSAESLYIKKIVSVVYDDSGSMVSDDAPNWAYASYAMQAFCGLLNSDDKLFITYMSEAEKKSNLDPPGIDLSAAGIQASVDAIRTHTDYGNTPYSAVDIAFNKLKNVFDSNSNTQYWLVVITDGEFQSGLFGTVSKAKLNESLLGYSSQTMPNGTSPQITYLAIGKNAVKPDQNTSKGIYVYSSSGSTDLIDVMATIADKVSGRSRLSSADIHIIGNDTVQITSSVPLLNIAVLSQKTSAKISGAKIKNGNGLRINRSVSISYPQNNGWKTDTSLIGGACLIDNSGNNIAAGTYTIQFDRTVSLDDFVIMFEPALEIRMSLLYNEKELSDFSALGDSQEGDVISVACKIYEVGTNNEISPGLLPGGTSYSLTVYENGSAVKSSDNSAMSIGNYTLKNCETRISAEMKISGFNPITQNIDFLPGLYVPPPVVYTITAEIINGVKSIKADKLPSNRELQIGFTVYADGNVMTDKASVMALEPQITVSPEGNGGLIEYSGDGKIIFTPNSTDSSINEYIDVTVTCSVNDAAASETYTVVSADFAVCGIGADSFIRKTEFFGNDVGVSFYITKDGVKLDKAAVEGNFTVFADDNHDDLRLSVSISNDGTITCIPYSENEHKITFGSWWWNWIYYFGLCGKDVNITLSHFLGTAAQSIDVVGATGKYQLLNVYLPLFLELLFISAVTAYLIRYFTKARFASNAVLYTGSISYNRDGSHQMELHERELGQYNTFKNLFNPFKELTVSVSGVSITAAHGNKIICNEKFPWYSDEVRPRSNLIRINSPKDIVNYCNDNRDLQIFEIRPICVMDMQNRFISLADSVYYFVKASPEEISVYGSRRREILPDATVFCYSTKRNY